jgi:4-cresol dehydrogenase (hydroxylating)
VVGKQWVLATDLDRETYLDAYALGDGTDHAASAAVAPQSVAEVQAIVRIANELKIPLWPVARGKNLGYGAAAPRMSGTVVLDLGRMNRILDVDPRYAHCLIEPGVGFFDLFNYLRDQKIPLWMSVPGNAWGSVVGNALERGIGYTPYGDNTAKICGLEVVLPTAELIRTGTGALTNTRSWQHYQYGFGPSWDQMFVQSNLGIVTKMGLWLMPEPAATMRARVSLPQPEDISWAIDELAQLRRQNVIDNNMVFGNYLHDAAVVSQREKWFQGEGAISDSASQAIMDSLGVGWWSFGISLCGHPDVVEARSRIVRAALEPHLKQPLQFDSWRRGDPLEKSGMPVPSVLALQIVNWRGGRGGHIGFSPVMPPDGALALAQFRRMKARFEEYGHDYYTSFTLGQRHINNVNIIVYDRDNKAMTDSARILFKTLIADSAREGYGEYRTHIEFMDDVAQTFDFNHHMMMRLNETVKDALDPNGILAPGKNGIWPRDYRGSRS